MNLRDRFSAELKEAMKAKEQKRVGALRLILAALKERDIANRSETSREGISDDEILSLLAKMVKQREESAAAYEGGGRPELAKAEQDEIVTIRTFMPTQLSAEEMKTAIAKVISETGASSLKDMGKVMSALKERFAGQLDFGRAGAAVKEILGAPK